MGDIGESLKRKLGPLPVWVWALIAGVGLYAIRSRTAGGTVSGKPDSVAATQAEAQLVQAEGAAQAENLQAAQILSEGQTVYDPNTGFISSQPNPGLTDALTGILGSLLVPPPAPRNTAANRKHHKHRKHTGESGGNTIGKQGPGPAPGGAHKPKAPKGYHSVGLGHGRWRYVKNGSGPKVTNPGHHKAKRKKKGGNGS